METTRIHVPLFYLACVAVIAAAVFWPKPVEYEFPVQIVDHDDQIWVVEKAGRVVSTDGDVLIDLNIDLTESRSSEQGLLGIEFGPSSYWLYVAWPKTGESELWQMPYHATMLTDGILLRSWGEAPWHHGGHMEYHEPWLYVGVGDGAAGAAHADHAQDFIPDRGAILRHNIQTGVWEPAARGLRNPWGWTLVDKVFYIGDVGAQSLEEVNIAPANPYPNFGWPVYEGTECVVDGCDLDHVGPVYTYRNADNCSAVIMGGPVDGSVFWTDFCTGHLYEYVDGAVTVTESVFTQPTSMTVIEDVLWVTQADGSVSESRVGS